MGMIHGFESVRKQEIRELKTRAELFRHVKTGAELLSLTNGDENKVFGITFRTPPSDSTGVPHILEHSVLCGSRKYPVKEPFVELLKGSLQTFLNAFTYPDKTCYPVASQNLQDFYNLIDIYLDAVFYPRLTPHVLQQEGWHYDIEEKNAPLNYKGVVFNEMKGVYSSPDSILAEISQQSLFPDITYGLDSGGDPKKIPDLTFERFEAFHDRFYHPSNARIYFYGDDDPEKRLALVNDYLKDFERIDIASEIPLQKPFEKPGRLTRPFAASGAEEQGSKGMLTLNWVLEETSRPERNLAMHMLEYILLGMAGSPLRKALIDSNYGEDLAGEGLGSELRQMYFSIGLKGVDLMNADKVEALILGTLKRLAEEGIDPLTVEAALNTAEFALRENNTGNFPRGLVIMLRALNSWLYDEDPLELVAFEAPLEAVKSAVAAGDGFFEGMIDRFFLKNPHRITLLLQPDTEMAEREEKDERERLDKARKAMSPAEIEEAVRTTKTLQKIQKTPDPPEALATIPSLSLKDLDRQNRLIPLALSEEKGARLLYHDLFTNGIAYLEVGLNLHSLPQKYLPYVRLFGRALLEMGTETEDFVSLTQRISRKTGGIHPSYFTSGIKDSDRAAAWLFLRGKAMMGQTEDLLGIVRDVLLTVRLDNRERFRQMVLESKARQEQKLVPAGHQIVNERLRAHFSEADWATEKMAGLSYLFFLRDLTKAVDEDWPRVLRDLEDVKRILVDKSAMVINVTLDQEGWKTFEPQVKAFLETLPAASSAAVQGWSPETLDDFEGMTIPAQVNYVGKAGNLYSHGYHFHGSAHVICRYLRNSWLWDRVRVQGGAYGAFCLFSRLSGVVSFVSYRDPNLIKTLRAFDESTQFLRHIDLSKEELTKAVIGAIGDIDQYQLPDAKGFTSMVRYLSGETDEERQKIREEVLGTTADDFRRFGEALEGIRENGLVKVLGSEAAIQEGVTQGQLPLKILKVL